MHHTPARRLFALIAALALIAGACASTSPSDPGATTASSSGAATASESSAASAAATGNASAAASPTPAPTATPIKWNDCGNSFQCGFVDVPRDYADPGGPTLRLAVTRVAATDPAHRIGALVVNPGGPGAPATAFVRDAIKGELFPKAIREQFDIEAFDPPGIGMSVPIRCMDPDDHHIPKDIQPDNAAEIAELVADAEALADGCGKRNPIVLSHMSTADVARDMDLVRASLGEAKLTYLGFSYGTLIGATYASLYPEHVRALVLDGPMDPAISIAKMREDQSKAFDKALNRFLVDCAKHTSCVFHSNGHPADEFDDLMARIDKSPIPSTALGREAVGPTLAWDAVLHSLYSSESWPLLAYALEAANRGDASLLLLLSDPYQGRQADGTYSNLIDAYFGVMCLDFPTSSDPKAFTTLAARLVKVAPEFGRMLAYNDLPCAFWPTKAQRTPAAITAKGAPPIVVIGSTGDPATPYSWAVSLDRQLASSTLVTREGEGHTSYLSDACVTKAVSPYLLTLKLPKPGLTCP